MDCPESFQKYLLFLLGTHDTETILHLSRFYLTQNLCIETNVATGEANEAILD